MALGFYFLQDRPRSGCQRRNLLRPGLPAAAIQNNNAGLSVDHIVSEPEKIALR